MPWITWYESILFNLKKKKICYCYSVLMKCMSSYCVTVCVSWRRKSTCRLFLGLQGFLWMEACCALTVGWMNGRERRTNEWERWRDVCGEIGRGGGYVILRFRSASRELVCLWLILSGWGGGRGLGMARERESERARERRAEGGGDRDEEDEEKKAGKEGSGLFLSYL